MFALDIHKIGHTEGLDFSIIGYIGHDRTAQARGDSMSTFNYHAYRNPNRRICLQLVLSSFLLPKPS